MTAGLILNRSRQVPAEETTAFGAVAERFRRAGDLERAVALCREGLHRFPDHMSARVTLGWALLDQGKYDEARAELERVIKRAPDNLAAIRGLAQLHEHRHLDEVGDVHAHSDWIMEDSAADPLPDETPNVYVPPNAAAATSITDDELVADFGDLVGGSAAVTSAGLDDDFPGEEDLSAAPSLGEVDLDPFLAEEGSEPEYLESQNLEPEHLGTPEPQNLRTPEPQNPRTPEPENDGATFLELDAPEAFIADESLAALGPAAAQDALAEAPAANTAEPDQVLLAYRNAMPLPSWDDPDAPPVALTFDDEPIARRQRQSPLDVAFARAEQGVDGLNPTVHALEGILRHVQARQASDDLAWQDV